MKFILEHQEQREVKVSLVERVHGEIALTVNGCEVARVTHEGYLELAHTYPLEDLPCISLGKRMNIKSLMRDYKK